MSTRLEWALTLAHCEQHFTACRDCADCCDAMQYLADVWHETARHMRLDGYPHSGHYLHSLATEASIMAKGEAA